MLKAWFRIISPCAEADWLTQAIIMGGSADNDVQAVATNPDRCPPLLVAMIAVAPGTVRMAFRNIARSQNSGDSC